MDNLTHTLTGLMLSRAGLNRWHPRASLLLILAANTPDVDGLTLIAGVPAYFQHHRSFTHALAMLPLVAVLPLLIVRLIYRREPFAWVRGWTISAVAVASHLLLDFTNPYGIRLFLPFSDAWPALSITNVVDIWIWGLLLLAALAPALSRLVSSEIGGKTSKGRGWAIAALLLIAAYDCSRAVLHSRAVSAQLSDVYEGESARRAVAYPNALNPFEWQGIVETGSMFVTRSVHLTGTAPLGNRRIFYKPAVSPAITAAAATPIFRTLAGFSQALLWKPAPGANGGTEVQATDLFFGFTATARLDSANRVQSTDFRF